MGSAAPIKIENPLFHHEANFNYALRARGTWGSSLTETQFFIYIIFMYTRKRDNQGLATGGGRRGGGWMRGITGTRLHLLACQCMVGTGVCREKRAISLQRGRRRGRPGKGCESRLRQVSYHRRIGTLTVFNLEQFAKSRRLIRVRAAGFEGGLEEEVDLLNWQQYIIVYSRAFSPCANQDRVQEAPSGLEGASMHRR